jgi:anti-sigma B factor antagonist
MGYLQLMQISVQSADGGRTTLLISGELDVATAAELRGAGEQAIAAGSQTLVLDLSDVTFLDSSGLGALIAIRNASLAAGCALVLLHPSDRVNKVLELSGLTGVFDRLT